MALRRPALLGVVEFQEVADLAASAFIWESLARNLYRLSLIRTILPRRCCLLVEKLCLSLKSS